MKSIALMTLMALTFSTQAMSFDFPSFSNSDFEATAAKARQVAESKAELFAADMGLDVTAVEELDQSPLSLKASYLASTNSDCKFVVSVGLFFRSKIESTSNCQ